MNSGAGHLLLRVLLLVAGREVSVQGVPLADVLQTPSLHQRLAHQDLLENTMESIELFLMVGGDVFAKGVYF